MEELNKIPSRNPFKVPENYFQGFEERIMVTASETGKDVGKKGLMRRIVPYLAAAASVAILATIGYTLFFNEKNEPGMELISEIPSVYFDESVLNEIDLATLEDQVAASGSLQGRSGLTKGEIIEYLVEENISVFDIYENLK